MPRKEPYPYSHWIKKTRKEHKCDICGLVIPVGVEARYKNGLAGKQYIHGWPSCPPSEEWPAIIRAREKNRKRRDEK